MEPQPPRDLRGDASETQLLAQILRELSQRHQIDQPDPKAYDRGVRAAALWIMRRRANLTIAQLIEGVFAPGARQAELEQYITDSLAEIDRIVAESPALRDRLDQMEEADDRS